MDVYHEDFRDSIAIDARIEGISKAFGIESSSYAEHEAFYLSIATEAGLNGWELRCPSLSMEPQSVEAASSRLQKLQKASAAVFHASPNSEFLSMDCIQMRRFSHGCGEGAFVRFTACDPTSDMAID